MILYLHQYFYIEFIDNAIYAAVTQKKPVYLEIPCNLARHKVPVPTPLSFEYSRSSDPESLSAAVADIVSHIEVAVKPVVIGGVKIRKAQAKVEFQNFVERLGAGVAMMPDAKSLFSEHHPQYIGRYWPSVSTPYCIEVVESSDLFIMAGPIINDYTTTGWHALIPPSKTIDIQSDHVTVCGTRYNKVRMPELFAALAESVPLKTLSLDTYKRYTAENQVVTRSEPPDDVDAALTLHELRRQVQDALTSETELVIETGK